ncbi:MAG: MFS transporter [Ruminococcaceae bacterium]|nr:MFS transporter [Oscillospiraceae bacterium]
MKRFHYAWVIAVSCFLMQGVVVGLILNCRGQFLTPVCDSMGYKMGEFTLYLFFQGIVSFFFTPIAGRIMSGGKFKPAMITAVIILSLALFLSSFATHLWHFYLSGIMMGLSMPMLYVLAVPVLTNNWFVKRRGLVLGISAGASGLMGVVGNLILAEIIESKGWRSGYLVIGLTIAIVLLPVTIFLIRLKPEDKGLKAYGYNQKEETDIYIESSGMTAKQALGTASFWFIALTGFFVGTLSAVPQLLQSYTTFLGKASSFAATVVSVGMFGNIFCKLLLGYIVDRLGSEKTSYFSIFMLSVSAFLILFPKNEPLLFVGAFFTGMSTAMLSTGFPVVIKTLFGNKDYSSVYSYFAMATGLASALGLSIYGFMIDYYGDYRQAIMMSVIMGLAALTSTVLAFLLMKRRNLRENN